MKKKLITITLITIITLCCSAYLPHKYIDLNNSIVQAKSREFPGYLLSYNPDYYDINVCILQQALTSADFDPGRPDGYFGWKTQKAVKEFQHSCGISEDGIVGIQTWNELFD